MSDNFKIKRGFIEFMSVVKKKIEVKLNEVRKLDYRFLYDLLKNRDPITNISHIKMPTYLEHVNFVDSKPYSKWYIIKHKNQKIGSVYLSKNDEVGIFVKEDFQGEGVGEIILHELMKKNTRKRYIANVSIKNKGAMKFFEKNKFKLIQHTYEFRIKD